MNKTKRRSEHSYSIYMFRPQLLNLSHSLDSSRRKAADKHLVIVQKLIR
jgi:hypothetical protein